MQYTRNDISFERRNFRVKGDVIDVFPAYEEIAIRIETFGKNELGIWAIQFSTDKLTDLARNALTVARKKFEERDVKYGNVFEAIRAYQEAMFYLETVRKVWGKGLNLKPLGKPAVLKAGA